MQKAPDCPPKSVIGQLRWPRRRSPSYQLQTLQTVFSYRGHSRTLRSCPSTMASQHFLHAVNLGLTQKPKRKSELASYFAAHREFQEENREPSSSPETSPSSGYPSTTQLCNGKRPLFLVYESSDPDTNKPAKRHNRGDGLRKPSYKGPERALRTMPIH